MSERTMKEPNLLQGDYVRRAAWGEEREQLIPFLKEFMTQLERQSWESSC